MSVKEPVNRGGLFRCCIATLQNFSGETSEGMVIKCAHCKDGKMKLENGVWKVVLEPEESR